MEESVRKSGKPGHRQESVWESGEPGDMQESVCDSGESVRGLSLRALRARSGGDHAPAQLWTNIGPQLCRKVVSASARAKRA